MTACEEIRNRTEEILAASDMPPWVREHVSGCRACADALAAAGLAAALVKASVSCVEPAEGFAERVARLAGGRRLADDVEMWRPAWGLVPTFAAILAGLLFWQQEPIEPEPVSLFPTEGVTLAERLVLAADEFTPDTILRAVLEVNGR